MKYFNFLTKIRSFLQHRFSKNPYVIVALGDSCVEGIGATSPEKGFAYLVYTIIKSQKRNSEFHNLGKSGAKVEDVLKFQLDQAIQLKPDLVLLSIGTNDLMKPTRTFAFDKNYNYLLKSLAKKTGALIVVNNIPDFSITPRVPKLILPWFNIVGRRFNRTIKKYTEEIGAVLIDLYSQSKILHSRQELICKDGFHPSDLGYDLWSKSIVSKIHPLIN